MRAMYALKGQEGFKMLLKMLQTCLSRTQLLHTQIALFLDLRNASGL